MPAGRPRDVSLLPEEMIELGKEMVKWVKDNKPLHLSEWYTIEKLFIYEEWKTFIQKKEFIPYYEQALKLVGKQYLDKNSDVSDSIKQRWQRVYFKELKEDEDDLVRLKAELSRQKQDENDENTARAVAQAVAEAKENPS